MYPLDHPLASDTRHHYGVQPQQNDQHPDHEFGVNGGAARMAVVLCQVSVEFTQIQTAIDGSKKVGRRNDVFKVEGVEQPLLSARLMTHHVGAP